MSLGELPLYVGQLRQFCPNYFTDPLSVFSGIVVLTDEVWIENTCWWRFLFEGQLRMLPGVTIRTRTFPVGDLEDA